MADELDDVTLQHAQIDAVNFALFMNGASTDPNIVLRSGASIPPLAKLLTMTASQQVPVSLVTTPGATPNVPFAANGDILYVLTLSQNAVISIPTPSSDPTFRRMYLVIVPNGFTSSLPASGTLFKWSGGTAPIPDTANFTLVTFGTFGTTLILGGI